MGKAYEYMEFWHRKSSSFKQSISLLFNNVWTSTALFLTSWWFLLFSLCWEAGPWSGQWYPARAAPHPVLTNPAWDTGGESWGLLGLSETHLQPWLKCLPRCPAFNLPLCWNMLLSDLPGMGRWDRGSVFSERPSPFGSILLARGNCLEEKSATVPPDQPSKA